MGDVVFVGSCNGVVHGIDKVTGRARWTYDARQDGGQPEFHGQPLIAGGLVVTASDDRRPEGIGHLYAFEARTGRLRWKRREGAGAMTDIVRVGSSACAVSLEDRLVCFGVATGQPRWSLPSGASFEVGSRNISATPAVETARIYFAGSNGHIYALDGGSGRVLWERTLGVGVEGSPARQGHELYLVTADGGMARLDRRTGRVLGRQNVPGFALGPLAVAEASLVLFTGDPESPVLTGLDLRLDGVRWTRPAQKGGWTSARPYLWRGLVLVGSGRGELAAFRPRDGAPAWSGQLPVPAVVRGIGLDRDVLYVGTLKGTIYALRAGNNGR